MPYYRTNSSFMGILCKRKQSLFTDGDIFINVCSCLLHLSFSILDDRFDIQYLFNWPLYGFYIAIFFIRIADDEFWNHVWWKWFSVTTIRDASWDFSETIFLILSDPSFFCSLQQWLNLNYMLEATYLNKFANAVETVASP